MSRSFRNAFSLSILTASFLLTAVGSAADPEDLVTTLPRGTSINFKERVRVMANTSETSLEGNAMHCVISHPAKDFERFISPETRFELVSVSEENEVRILPGAVHEVKVTSGTWTSWGYWVPGAHNCHSPNPYVALQYCVWESGPSIAVTNYWASMGLQVGNGATFYISCGAWFDDRGYVPTVDLFEKMFALKIPEPQPFPK